MTPETQTMTTSPVGVEINNQTIPDMETPQEFIARTKLQEVRDMKPYPTMETNASVFKHFLGDKQTDYFWYDGIKVFIKGTREEIERKERLMASQQIFGAPN